MRKTCHFAWCCVLLTFCLGAVSAGPVFGQRPERPGVPDKTLSPYFVVLSDDPGLDALPLKSTRAEVKIAGVVAGVTITQVYKNAGKKTLEAVYVFPMSTRAAVHAMRMTVGPRVIEAEIMERQKARQTYEDAKKEGKTTSLLEQQRPNVFQMNVANILPGDEIKVEMKYMELLQPQDNIYEFVYPTVVGPRYSNMPAKDAPDTEKWVQSPYLREGQPPPYTFGLSVEVNSAVPLAKVASSSHEVEITYPDPKRAQIKIKDEQTAGNKDFVLRYGLAGDQIETGLLLYPGKDENFFLMMMAPPAPAKAEAATVPREYIFIVDVSGSMHGYPLETSKALMQEIISGLKPHDFINVLLFESGNAVLAESGSLAANEENKQKALAFIQAQPGGGGTQILPAFQRALALPRTPGTSRIVVVATDGYVHVEPQLFEMVRQNLGAANLFPFGIGTSVNRHLIEGLARAGMGEPFVILNAAEAPKQAARFRRYIANPVLTNIKAVFEGFGAYEVEPAALPDLFALRPITLLGKYRGSPAGSIVVTGKTLQGDFRQEVKVTPAQANADNAALRLLWARQRIMNLADFGRHARDSNETVKEITALGLKYSLMTQYTSFVAVDKVKRADGQLVTVKQPLPLPEGVSDLAVGGPRASVSRKMAYQSALDFTAREHGLRPAAPSPGIKGKPATAAEEKVVLKIVQVRTKLDQAAIRQVLEANLAQLATCWQEAAAKGVKLPGKLTLIFEVGADGRVTGKVLFKPALPKKLPGACLSRVVQGLTFPNPNKQVEKVMVEVAVSG